MFANQILFLLKIQEKDYCCLLYTSDAADEEDSVDLGGRRIIKKKKIEQELKIRYVNQDNHACEDKTPTRYNIRHVHVV